MWLSTSYRYVASHTIILVIGRLAFSNCVIPAFLRNDKIHMALCRSFLQYDWMVLFVFKLADWAAILRIILPTATGSWDDTFTVEIRDIQSDSTLRIQTTGGVRDGDSIGSLLAALPLVRTRGSASFLKRTSWIQVSHFLIIFPFLDPSSGESTLCHVSFTPKLPGVPSLNAWVRGYTKVNWKTT